MNDFLPNISLMLDSVLDSLLWFYPELVLGILFILVIITDLFFSKRFQNAVFLLTSFGLGVVGYFILLQLNAPSETTVFSGMIRPDKLSTYFKVILCVVSLLFLLFIRDNKELKSHDKGTGDLHAILIAVLFGMNLMVMSSNLLMIYLSIEMVSVGSYIMVGYISGTAKQTEAAMKYALFGAVCSAMMLYGMSLVYAFTGTLNFIDPAFLSGLSSVSTLSSGIALGMIMVGIGFKLSFVPMHFWTPDVYEGAPTPVTAFLATGPKIAGFALLIRLLDSLGGTKAALDFNEILGGIALITMIAGNFSAIWQNNVKRMLAYSSIGHTGFILLSVLAFSQAGQKALIFYLSIYALMNMAAFMLADYIEEKSGAKNLDEYKGLGQKLPLTFFLFVIVLVSLTGLPPTAGFIGKLLVFSAALEMYNSTGSLLVMVLIIAGALVTLVSLFYYIKVPLNAYLRQSNHEVEITEIKTFKIYLSLFLTIIILVLGIFPQLLTSFIVI